MVASVVRRHIRFISLLLLATVSCVSAQSFDFPTANRALLEPDGGAKFFVGTAGNSWESGCFGCVRSDGWRLHEGLDIRCLERDRRGEPTDAVLATADGLVMYVNAKAPLSNYGNYIVLRHEQDGLEVYSLYAHLREIRADLKVGQGVKAGETIAIMGRTANTREGISRDRAHVHFELNLFINEGFSSWFRKINPGERNDHGIWNGQNLLGLDPRPILLGAQAPDGKFNLLTHVRTQTELCRVQIRKKDFPWLKRYRLLVRINPIAQREGIAGYEIALNYNGVPFDITPRAESELKSANTYHLLSVNEAEYRKNPCRRIVARNGERWELAAHGRNLLDLLTY